jgi:hypothetical protein
MDKKVCVCFFCRSKDYKKCLVKKEKEKKEKEKHVYDLCFLD